MLFHIQFPFTDLRSFSLSSASRISVPSWPAPIVGEEFIRSFGAVRKRRSGGISGWIAEAEYCDTRRALSFPSGALDGQAQGIAGAPKLPLKVAFRRLYFDGFAVGMTEIGLCPLALPSTPVNLEEFAARVLTISAGVRKVKKKGDKISYDQRALCRIGKPLAAFYAHATSPFGPPTAGNVTSDVVGEAPILFIEVGLHEAAGCQVPKYARQIALAATSPFDLFFWRCTIAGETISVWCAIARQPVSMAEIRGLRIYLLRLNAEHQSLKRVFKALATGKVAPQPRSEAAHFLQNYVNEATRRIGKCQTKAQAYSGELDTMAFSIFDVAQPGERDALVERLRLLEARGNIIRKVETYADQQVIQLHQYGGTVNLSQGGDITTIADSRNVNVGSTLTNVQQNTDSTLTEVRQAATTPPLANKGEEGRT